VTGEHPGECVDDPGDHVASANGKQWLGHNVRVRSYPCTTWAGRSLRRKLPGPIRAVS
jgi:hypothetical protein